MRRLKIEKVVECYGRLDCAFNNAGIGGNFASIAKCTIENWQRTIAKNLSGVFYCMKYEIAQMLTQDGGSTVNTSSVAGLVGGRRTGAYAAAKHGVLGLTKTAALEFAKANIHVNAGCGFVASSEAVGGHYCEDCHVAEINDTASPLGVRSNALDSAHAEALWSKSEEMVGVKFPVD